MVTVRIESIYDIPLAKLLLDNLDGLKFSYASKDMQDLLGIEHNIHVHDVQISDLENKSGISIEGSQSLISKIERIFLDNLPDVVAHRQMVQKDAIYVASIAKVTRKNLIFLNLGESQGILFGTREKRYEEGRNIIVQVKELPTEPDKLPVCSEDINLSGKLVILEKSPEANFVRVSKKIRGDARERLHSIGKKIRPEGFGIIMRTSAAESSEEEIAKEIEELGSRWMEISSRKRDDAQQVEHGSSIIQISFARTTRKAMDQIRNTLGLIIPDYYSLKAYSLATNYALEFGNKFVTTGNAQSMSDALYEMIYEKDYQIDSHTKGIVTDLYGSIYDEYVGNIKDHTGDIFVMQNVLDEKFAEEDKSNYVLFADDYIITHYMLNGRTVYYQYMSGDDNELIGERVKIITPLDLVFRGRFRMTDLGINIYLVNEEDSEIDVEYEKPIDQMLANGMISQDTADSIEKLVDKVSEQLMKREKKPILLK